MNGFTEVVGMAVPPVGSAMPTGILSWDDAGAMVVVFALAAFVGTLLSLLRKGTGQRPTRSLVRPIAGRRLAHPA